MAGARAIVAVMAIALMATGCWHSQKVDPFVKIHQLAQDGDVAGVAAELDQYPDELNLVEKDGITPLHLAAENCHTNVVALLLDRGAKIDIRADDQATPLILAAQEGCVDAAALLVARGAKVNLQDDKSRTALKRAEEWRQDAMAQWLRQHGGTE